MGWGNGPHTCVGIHLAKLEMRSLLEAMVPRVAAVTVGEPLPLRNNTLQGIARLPAGFTAA
jgi:cytochrome P450